MDELHKLIGQERSLEEVSRALRNDVQRLRPPVVGALHVTCSDEAEQECMEAFQRWFVEESLPGLKAWRRAPFRTSNLGARYEWGSIRIAEEHFATPSTRARFKVVVAKIDSHVGVREAPGGRSYGRIDRYDTESACCGALHALLGDAELPAFNELRGLFGSDDCDRLAALRDAGRVEPAFRSLFVAVASACLQARRALADIREQRPASPTLYLVLPCVTLNRAGPDTELLCGVHIADCRSGDCQTSYVGLGDDPTRYQVEHDGELLRIKDASHR